MDLLVKNGRVVDPARKIDTVDECAHSRRQDSTRSALPMSPIFRFSMPRVLSWRPASSTSTCICASPARKKPKRSRSGGAAAVAGGFTAVAAMPNTKPPNDNPSITHYIVSEARRSSPARVFPIGAITKEQKGETLAEIGEMFEAGIVGISDDGKPVMDAQLFRRALEYAQMFDCRSFSIAKICTCRKAA